MRLLVIHIITIGLCSAATIPSPDQNAQISMNKPRARSLPPQMSILDQKRNPKPKRPIGNDIGTARELDTSKKRYPTVLPDHLETTISVGYTMTTTTNSTTPPKDEESAQVSRELHEIMDAIPTMPSIFMPNLQVQQDPEEEDLNRRITQVARQLTETEIRKEYEQEKKTTTTKIEQPTTTTAKPEKEGKSFLLANTLPLVSHQPLETSQLQLIAELQQIPHYLIDEGFQPRTPAPELIGPLLGGPPLKPENTEEDRSGKSIQNYMSSNFIKLMALPKYEIDPNNVVISIPAYSIPLLGPQPQIN